MKLSKAFTLNILLGLMITAASGYALAASSKPDSTKVGLQNMTPQQLRGDVDTNNCTQPIKSSPYVVVAGSGGGDHDLSCPADHPVMYSWRQQLGFSGLPPFMPAIIAGGGNSWIKCCAMKHEWKPVS